MSVFNAGAPTVVEVEEIPAQPKLTEAPGKGVESKSTRIVDTVVLYSQMAVTLRRL